MLRIMTGQGEMSVRAIAFGVGRALNAVENDPTALVDAGLIERTADGVVFAYDAVHVELTLTKDSNPLQAA
jgi:predicted transcriptional regulator